MESASQKEEYKKFAQDREPKRPVFINCLRAFIVGGSICEIGEILQWFFMRYMSLNKNAAAASASSTLIIISVIITGLGHYDKLAQWAGAGTAVPITGFANGIASSAIEHRSEGYVLGVGTNMFRIAGPVIVYGVFSAFVITIIRMLFIWIGGI